MRCSLRWRLSDGWQDAARSSLRSWCYFAAARCRCASAFAADFVEPKATTGTLSSRLDMDFLRLFDRFRRTAVLVIVSFRYDGFAESTNDRARFASWLDHRLQAAQQESN
jgi:hypothetical protein